MNHAKESHREKGRKAYEHTQERVYKEGSHTYEKGCFEIVDLFVHHISGWITESEEADFQYSDMA